MTKGWTRKHTYLLIGIFLTIIMGVALAFILVINPLKEEAEKLDTLKQLYSKQLEKLDEGTDEKSTDTVDELLKKVPAEKVPENLLTGLQSIAVSTDVSIEHLETGLQPGVEDDKKENSRIQEITYLLNVSSNSLENINRFLDELIAADRIVRINTMNVQKEPEQTSLSITFTVFYFK